ncbi:phosphotransferase [Streptomyces sp. NPDC002577]
MERAAAFPGREGERLPAGGPGTGEAASRRPCGSGSGSGTGTGERWRRAGGGRRGGSSGAGRPASGGRNDRCGAQEWLVGGLDRLSSHLQGTSPHVLLHGDIAPQNIMVSPDSADLGGLVDWGDAVWADPAVEFAKTPLADVVTMLKGYREENGEEPSAGSADNAGSAWEARILRHHLVWSLGRLVNPAANPGARHWTAPPASRLLGLLRFYASAPEKPWRDLT